MKLFKYINTQVLLPGYSTLGSLAVQYAGLNIQYVCVVPARIMQLWDRGYSCTILCKNDTCTANHLHCKLSWTVSPLKKVFRFKNFTCLATFRNFPLSLNNVQNLEKSSLELAPNLALFKRAPENELSFFEPLFIIMLPKVTVFEVTVTAGTLNL